MSNERSRVRVTAREFRDRHRAGETVGVAVLTAVVGLLGGVPVAETIVISPVAGLVVPFAIHYGVDGVVGVATGALVGRALRGPLVAHDGAVVLAYLVAGLVAAACWRELAGGSDAATAGPTVPDRVRRHPSVVSALRYGTTALVAAVAAATTLSWVREILSVSPFFLSALVASGFAGAALVVGGPVFALTGTVLERTDARTPSRAGDRTLRWAVLAVPGCWLLVGTAASVLFRSFDPILTASPHWFDAAGVGAVELLADQTTFGVGGARVQTVLGAVFVALLLTVVARSHALGWRDDDDE